MYTIYPYIVPRFLYLCNGNDSRTHLHGDHIHISRPTSTVLRDLLSQGLAHSDCSISDDRLS